MLRCICYTIIEIAKYRPPRWSITQLNSIIINCACLSACVSVYINSLRDCIRFEFDSIILSGKFRARESSFKTFTFLCLFINISPKSLKLQSMLAQCVLEVEFFGGHPLWMHLTWFQKVLGSPECPLNVTFVFAIRMQHTIFQSNPNYFLHEAPSWTMETGSKQRRPFMETVHWATVLCSYLWMCRFHSCYFMECMVIALSVKRKQRQYNSKYNQHLQRIDWI